jgi:L-cysteate sulfo-lyase
MNHQWISDVPRLELGFLPTPLTPLDRLSEVLGGPRIWLKRDDCTGLATGGNKTRKLEYLLADAVGAGADVIVTFGAAQSNHARQTAAACAAIGLPCHLVLARKVVWAHPGYETTGNLLLDRLLGAEVHLVEPQDAQAAGDRLLDDLAAGGGTPYAIPVGGSNAIGAMGYARCAMELTRQADERSLRLTDILHASSSAGTQAGLLAGFAGLAADRARPLIHGINVSEPDPERLPAEVLQLARSVITERGLDVSVDATAVLVDDGYLGNGYGLPTAGTIDAIRLLGRTEGVLMDPVYSGKAFSALLDRVRQGQFDGTADLVFIHTGGTAALAAYDNAFPQ